MIYVCTDSPFKHLDSMQSLKFPLFKNLLLDFVFEFEMWIPKTKTSFFPFKTLFIFIIHHSSFQDLILPIQDYIHPFKTSIILSRPHSCFQDLIHPFKTSFVLSRPHSCFQDLILPFKTSFMLSKPHSCFQDLIIPFKTSFIFAN